MRIAVSEIENADYAHNGTSFEPSTVEIADAIRERAFETRGFQSDLKELNDEWQAGGATWPEYCARQRLYHARRIAHFVEHGWDAPIVLNKDGRTVTDGLHRLKAARHKGCATVEVVIPA